MSGVIDLHVHYYTDRYLRALVEAPATDASYRATDGRLVVRWRGGIALTVPQPHPGVAERVEMMDELGIATQVLSVGTPGVHFLEPGQGDRLARDVNEELADVVAGHPSRFRALGALPLQDTDLALAALEHLLDQLGLDGVMILTNIDGTALDDPRLEPFWAAADERSLLTYVHPTIPTADHMSDFGLAIGVGFLGDTNLALARLAFSGVFERYPRIRWVFSHLGGTVPFMLPRIDNYHRGFPEFRELAPRPPSAYIREQLFDTASTHRPALRCAAETLGTGRLVFGSDYPHVGAGVGPFLENLDATGASAAELEAITGGRAAALLQGRQV